MNEPFTPEELKRHLDRIGADEVLRGGLATGPGIEPEDVITALRTTPSGSGTPGFEATLRALVEARRTRGAP